MAKDGTNRGGRRVRAGDKQQPLADKIASGKAAQILEASAGGSHLEEAGELRVIAPADSCNNDLNFVLLTNQIRHTQTM